MKKERLLYGVSGFYLFVLLFSVLISCSRDDVTNVGTNKGSISLQLLSQQQAARSINPNAEFRAASYEISGQGPKGATYPKAVVTTATPILSNLDAGLWTITVVAKNRAGVEIAKGTQQVTVEANKQNGAQLVLLPLQTIGELHLLINWSGITTPSVVASLKPMSGSSQSISFATTPSTASYTNLALSAGYYSLQLRVYDGSQLVSARVEAVHILPGHATAATFTTSGTGKEMTMVNTTDLTNSLTVTLSGQLMVLVVSNNMTVTATPSKSVTGFQWYSNGTALSGQTGSTITLGSNYATGKYRLDVVVTSTEGVFSTGTPFTVITNSTSDRVKIAQVYGWLTNVQMANGLVATEGSSTHISTYDNALAAIVFCVKGDFRSAEGILDFFNGRLATEMKVSPGGYSQFRYANGTPHNNTATSSMPHRWLGDNAWLLIAIANYHHLSGSTRYHAIATNLEAWIRSQQDATDGGVWGGYEWDGSKYVQIAKNIEGVVDAYVAVPGYDTFHQKILSFLGSGYWNNTDKLLRTPISGLYQYALDLCSWGYSAFREMPVAMLTKAEQLFKVTKTATANGVSVTGFCFDRDLDTVWFEGTGEMVVAYNTAGMLDKADQYLKEMEKLFVAGVTSGLYGIPYASNNETHFGAGGLWTGVDTKPSVSSSAWYLLGKLRYDPMWILRSKNIPESHKFWK